MCVFVSLRWYTFFACAKRAFGFCLNVWTTTYLLFRFFFRCRSLDTKSKEPGGENNSSRICAVFKVYIIFLELFILSVCSVRTLRFTTVFVIISKENFHLDFALKIIGNTLLPYSENISAVHCVCVSPNSWVECWRLPLIDFCQVCSLLADEVLFSVDSNENEMSMCVCVCVSRTRSLFAHRDDNKLDWQH